MKDVFELIHPNGTVHKMPFDQAHSVMSRQNNGGWKLKNEGDRAKLGLPFIKSANAVSTGDKGDTKASQEQGDNSGSNNP